MLNNANLRRSLLVALALVLVQCGSDPGTGPVITPTTIALNDGDQQTGGVGDSLLKQISVKVTGDRGAAVFGYTVTFTVISGGGAVSSPTATTDVAGIASVTWTLGPALGVNSQLAHATGGTLNGSPVPFVATGVPGSPSLITVLSGSGQNGEVGQAVPQPLVALAKDKFGNPSAQHQIVWAVTAGGGTVPVSVTTTDNLGQASQSWTLGNTVGVGAQTLLASAPTATTPAVFTANGVLTAGQLSLSSGSGQFGAASTRLVGPINVLVRTLSSNPVSGVTVQWQPQPGEGTLDSTSTKTNAQGIASTTWVLGAAGGSDTVTASVVGLTPPSVVFSATAVVPTPSAITGQVSVTSAFLAPPASSRGLRFGGSAGPDARLAADPTVRLTPANYPNLVRARPKYSTNDLIVSFRSSAIGAPPIGSIAMMSLTTAQAVSGSIHARLAGREAPGRVRVADVSPALLAARVRVTNPAELDSVARALRADPAVARVGRDRMVYPDEVAFAAPPPGVTLPNDPNYPNQSWHYTMVDLPRAWQITTGSSNVIVADVDNGIRFEHPELGAPGATYLTGGGNLTNDGYDFVSTGAASGICNGLTIDNADDGDGYDRDPSIPMDFDVDRNTGSCLDLSTPAALGGHGLHTAGIIGARGNNGSSVTGINWSVTIRPIRVLGINGGSTFDVAQGVLYAAKLPVDGAGGLPVSPTGAPAQIINLSLGGSCPSAGQPDPLHDAITLAANAGALIVASAGNGASSVPSCPAAYPEVLSVSAVGPDGVLTSYSNFGSAVDGSKVDIAAPGGEPPFPFGRGRDGTFGIYSSTCDFRSAPCVPNQARYFGTSQAAPHVSGIAALILAANPGLTLSQLKSRLLNYAVPAGSPDQYGAGIVNARNSLTQTMAPPTALYVRLYDAATGAIVATQAAPGGSFTFSNLPDGNYYVFAGEDESADGLIGVPGRRWGALGGTANPTAVTVSTVAGATAFFAIGLPNATEPNEGSSSNRLVVGGYIHSQLPVTDPTDLFRISIPAAGQYTFQTSGWYGDFCKFGLDVNTVMALADSNKVSLFSNDDIDATNNNYCSAISATLTPGTYYIAVTPGVDFAAPPVVHDGRYRLEARAGP